MTPPANGAPVTGADLGSATPTTTVELTIGGMTCASCAARIEKKLNELDGVVASVNYAMESATLTYVDHLTVADLIAVVNDAGYTATVPAPPAVPSDPTDPTATQVSTPDPVDALRRRLVSQQRPTRDRPRPPKP